MKTINKSESNSNLKYPKNSNRRISNKSFSKKGKDNKKLLSSPKERFNNNGNSKKLFSTVRKNVIQLIII